MKNTGAADTTFAQADNCATVPSLEHTPGYNRSMSRHKQIITEKKRALESRNAEPLKQLAEQAAAVWQEPDQLDVLLQQGIGQLPHCSLIFAVDTKGILISSNVENNGLDTQWRGTELINRPFLENNLPYSGLTISHVYTSRHTMQPTLTVMQAVRRADEILGFIAADFDVDALPASPVNGAELLPAAWQQYKGDPAIRGTVFLQERILSAMDKVLDEAMDIITELMQHHGVFHSKIHFSSSRVSFWSVDDPYEYIIHTVDELIDPDVCLAYPRQPQFERIQVSEADIARILNLFKALRNADETIYLRSSSLNLINGMVGLTFSCDGSHYLHYQEFLAMDTTFWFGETNTTESQSA
jgi:hypothetical protein